MEALLAFLLSDSENDRKPQLRKIFEKKLGNGILQLEDCSRTELAEFLATFITTDSSFKILRLGRNSFGDSGAFHV